MNSQLLAQVKRLTCLMLFALSLFFVNQAMASQHAGKENSTAPVVNLKTWEASTPAERYAFLVGVVNILELEKEWQGRTGILPMQQSLVGSWVKGLDGVTLKTMHDRVNDYFAKNPTKMDKLVVEVLWDEFVQPTIKEKLPADKKTAKQASKTMQQQRN